LAFPRPTHCGVAVVGCDHDARIELALDIWPMPLR
jgi:hypothetical protein